MNGGRPRTLIGSYGTISVTRRGASYVALARIRDADGRLQVQASDVTVIDQPKDPYEY